MKTIKYSMCTKVNIGTDNEPNWVEKINPAQLPYSEANAAIAQREAYNGEITIEDDGKTVAPTSGERLAALEAAMLEVLGVNGNG